MHKHSSLKQLWVRNTLKLDGYCNVQTIGHIPPGAFERDGCNETRLQPDKPLPPQKDRTLPTNLPATLKDLYNQAAADMRKQGIEPDECYVYLLYHSGFVKPDAALRADYWHYDLLRLQNYAGADTMPRAMEYAVCNALPTLYASNPRFNNSDTALILRDKTLQQSAGQQAFVQNDIWRPDAGAIVRYDNFTLHSGAKNDTGGDIYRIFAHVAFAPVPG